MVHKAAKARNISFHNLHYITRHTQFKLHESRREQRLKISSGIFGPVNSSSDEKNIPEPLHFSAPKRHCRGVRPFHRHRNVPIKAISKNKKQPMTSRRKQQKLTEHFTSTNITSCSGNYSSPRLYHPRKQSYCDVHTIRGQPDGQDSSSERKKLSSTVPSQSLKLNKKSKPLLHAPVIYDSSSFDHNKLKNCSNNYAQIEEFPSISSTRTSKQPSTFTHNLVSDFIRYQPTPINIYKPHASSTTSFDGRSSQSLNFPVSHGALKDHSTLEKRGCNGIVSKSINPASVSPNPLFCINLLETSNETTYFSPPISKSTTLNSTPKHFYVSNERVYIEIISKNIDRFSPSPHTLPCICPIEISSPISNFTSPSSTEVEVGSMETTPEHIAYLPSTVESPILSETSQHPSEPIPYVPYNSPAFQSTSEGSCHIRNGSERLSQISGYSINPYRRPLIENFVYFKSVSEENDNNNTSLKEDNSLKSSFLYTSENTSSLPFTAKSSLLSGTSQHSSQPTPYVPYNSPAFQSTSEGSCHIQNGNEMFSQISGHTLNSYGHPIMGSFVYPITVSEENCQNDISLKENNCSKSSFLYHQKRQYSSQLPRTAPSNTSISTWALYKSGDNHVTTSISRPSLYPAVFYHLPITIPPNNSEATKLFYESNCLVGFRVPPNTPNGCSLSNSEESYNTENIVRSVSQYFDVQSGTCHLPTTEAVEVSNPSKPLNLELSGHCRNETRISKLISCFIACFRPFKTRREDES